MTRRVPPCPEHGRIHVPNPPTQDCQTCWATYGRWCAAQIEAGRINSKGRAVGGGQSSKAKGRSGVEAVQAVLVDELGLDVGDVFIKATSQIGVDLHLSPRALAMFPYAIEVKNAERLQIWLALAQAQDNATDDRLPVLFFKRARTALYVALDARHFVSVIRRLCLSTKLP